MLWVVDVSNPSNPEGVGFYLTQNLRDANNVTIVGDLAFVTVDTTGLVVLDVSAPWSIVEIGSLATPGNARHVVVSGSYAYVADGTAGLRSSISPTRRTPPR